MIIVTVESCRFVNEFWMIRWLLMQCQDLRLGRDGKEAGGLLDDHRRKRKQRGELLVESRWTFHRRYSRFRKCVHLPYSSQHPRLRLPTICWYRRTNQYQRGFFFAFLQNIVMCWWIGSCSGDGLQQWNERKVHNSVRTGARLSIMRAKFGSAGIEQPQLALFVFQWPAAAQISVRRISPVYQP